MMQGDYYGLKIEILSADGEAVTSDDVSDVEITVGFVRKTHADFDIIYNDGFWIMPLTQEETFKMPATRVKAQVRVKWKDGSVEGASLGEILVHESISKEVL